MAKSSWYNLEKIMLRVKKDYGKELRKEIKLLKDQILDMVRVRIVEGYGVPGHGSKKVKIKGLTKSTKDARKKKKLASYTAYDFSNQVETGKFVEGLKVKYTNTTIYIYPSRNREDMAAAQELNGRPTLYLSDEEIKFIEEELEKMLIELFEK